MPAAMKLSFWAIPPRLILTPLVVELIISETVAMAAVLTCPLLLDFLPPRLQNRLLDPHGRRRQQQQRAAAAAAAAVSYSNDGNTNKTNRNNYGGSFSSDDSDDDPDGLLSSGPIFPSSSASRAAAAAGGAGDGTATTGTNAAAERLRRTLSRLESLSSVASSTPASAAASNNNRNRSTTTASKGGRKRTAEERAAEAAAKKAQKAREVEGRKRAREAERAAKTRKKEEERMLKARRVLEDRQASGKFAAEEICALVDGDLARAGAGFGEAVGGSNASRSRDDGAVAAAAAAAAEGLGPMLLAALREKNHRVVVEGDTSLSTRLGESNVDDVAPVRWDGPPVGRGVGCVRWIRRNHVDGGSAGAATAPSSDVTVQRTDMVAIVFHEPGAFLKLLERDASAEARDDYPELRAWLGRVRTSLASRWEKRWKSDPEAGGGRRGKKSAGGGDSSNWTENNGGGNGSALPSSRLVLVLHMVQAELQRQWNSGGRRRQSFAPTSEEELNDATVWLLMEENVECTLTSCDDETVDYLVNMTRALSEAPYYEDVTELHCVKKLKADASATSVVEKAQCAWMRMARQVPGMSEAKARKLVEHFPTLMSLVEKYEDPNLTLDEKKRLLDDCLVEGRKSKKLSDSFYRLMTSNDPNELIS